MSPVAVKTDQERAAEQTATEATMQAQPQTQAQVPAAEGTTPGDVTTLPNEALDFAARVSCTDHPKKPFS